MCRTPRVESVTLRKLIEEAKTKNQKRDQIRWVQEATHRFMTAMAGNLPGYEEALRALYAKNDKSFTNIITTLPPDLRDYIQQISAHVMGAWS